MIKFKGLGIPKGIQLEKHVNKFRLRKQQYPLQAKVNMPQ